MNEDIAGYALLAFVAACFFGLLFGLGYSEHSQRMACIERGGTFAGSVCLYHVAPAAQSKEEGLSK